LSFITDPYQPIEKDLNITREALKILMANDLTVTILTKGGTWGLLRDKDLLQMNPANSWAVSLTCSNPEVSNKWEPFAAPPEERIDSLKIAHELGINTWVSFEPVLYPNPVYS
jgi:DNA repair photolyase